MSSPISDFDGEDRAHERVGLDSQVEAPDKPFDHDFINPGLCYDFTVEARMPLSFAFMLELQYSILASSKSGQGLLA